MRPRGKALLIALAFLVVCGGFAGWSATEFRRQETARKEIDRRIGLVRTEVSAILARAKEAEAQAAELAKPAEQTTTAESPDDSSPASASPDHATRAAERKAALAEYRADLDQTWGLLCAKLQLTPAQIEAFKDLLTQRKDNELTLEAEAAARQLPEDSPEIAAQEDAFDRRYKTALKQLLGPSGLSLYRTYYHDRVVMPIVMEAATATAVSDSPMSVDTTLGLMHLLADASERRSGGSANEDTIQWPKAMEAAKAVLTPPQLNLLATIQARRQAEEKLNRQLKTLGEAYTRNHPLTP
jgi:hypothetical protein